MSQKSRKNARFTSQNPSTRTGNTPGNAAKAEKSAVNPGIRGVNSFLPGTSYVKLFLLLLVLFSGGCLRYSFTGVSIPSDVSTIYIPFFSDNSGSGLSDLTDQLNESLINRFVNQTRLRLVASEDQADIVLNGSITGYSNQPFSVAGDQTASLNRVQITVNATFLYTRDEDPLWSRSFTGQAEYDPSVDPLEGETAAASEAMTRIAQNMFNDSVGRW